MHKYSQYYNTHTRHSRATLCIAFLYDAFELISHKHHYNIEL